jgi:ABC-type lipoprotein export system ATPase subunit
METSESLPAPDTQGDNVPGYDKERYSTEGWVEPYIECRDLFKIFKLADLEVVALRGVDLEVEPGKMIAIVGASGSGKSTLLNILSGLDRPSAGQVRVGRRDLLNITGRELVLYRRLEVGFVWQATARNLISYLTVRDNIELPQAIAGRDVKIRRARSLELLSVLDMEDKANRKIHELSGGEQQRLAIAVAMANSPPLLLADEPTGELDTQMASQVFKLLRDMNRIFNVTVIVVTHYSGVAEYMDRVLHIRDGRISSESYAESDPEKSGGMPQEEYLVVDRVGRLQLPQEYVDKLRMPGLAKAEISGDKVSIRLESNSARPDHRDKPDPRESA